MCFDFAAVTYSLHKCIQTMIKLTSDRLRVTCFSAHRSPWKQKNLPPNSSDLNLVNVLLWRALRQKLYHQDFRDLDYLKHVLLH